MAKKTKVSFSNWLHVSLQRIAVFHFLFAAGFAVRTMVYDASKVIAPDLAWKSWLALGALVAVTALVWYLAHNQNNDIAAYKRLTFLLVLADTAFASFLVYTERGMGSTAVGLYTLGIISAAILLSRAAVFAAAIVAATAYAVTAVSYFTLNFNEGYKAQLYGTIIFYGFSFMVVAGLLSVIVRFGGDAANS